jgi:hypothetical protein
MQSDAGWGPLMQVGFRESNLVLSAGATAVDPTPA